MLHHAGSRWWWLIVSGAAAINAYYFKPTGASLIIAMVIYLPVQGIFRHRKWRQVGVDVLAVLGGACVGIIPLACFYIWQGQWNQLAGTIPFFALKAVVPTALVGLVIYSLWMATLYTASADGAGAMVDLGWGACGANGGFWHVFNIFRF